MGVYGGTISVDYGGKMARKYDEKRVLEIIKYAKQVAPYFGIIECRKVMYLAEYLGAVSDIDVGILGIKVNKKFTIAEFTELFNKQWLNGISLSCAIQTEKEVSVCVRKPIIVSSVKKWLQEVDNGRSVCEFLAKIDRVTLFLLHNRNVPEECRYDPQINKKYRYSWTAYKLRAYYASKSIDVAIGTCTAAMRRVYLEEPLLEGPQKVKSIRAEGIKEGLHDGSMFLTPGNTYNIQDVINAITRGDFLEEKVMVLTWWWSDEDIRRDNFLTYSYHKIHYKVAVSGDKEVTYTDYFELSPKDCFDDISAFANQLVNAIGQNRMEKCDKIVMNRRDFMAPYIVHEIGKKDNMLYNKIRLLDFR